MKFKDKYNINKEFESLFAFKSKEEEFQHEAQMIMFRFLSEIEKINDTGNSLKKKELAEKLGVSPSYITQLYNGDKILNFTFLAKLQEAFDITFDIKAHSNKSIYSETNLPKETLLSFSPESTGVWVYHNLKKPDYSEGINQNKGNIEDSKTNAA